MYYTSIYTVVYICMCAVIYTIRGWQSGHVACQQTRRATRARVIARAQAEFEIPQFTGGVTNCLIGPHTR
jgi:hypothetical protein